MSKKNIFEMPYIGIKGGIDYDLLYGLNGDYSVILKIKNPVVQYSGSGDDYDKFHSLLLNIVKILGAGYLIQKQDIFSRSPYPKHHSDDFLQEKYNAHFAGRNVLHIQTYFTITRTVKKGAFYVYDKKAQGEFFQNLGKVMGVLTAAGCEPVALREKEINLFVKRMLAMNFKDESVALNNINPGSSELKMGKFRVRSISLINVDTVDLPAEIPTHVELNEKDAIKGFPVDLFSFLLKVPEHECIIFNQLIDIPSQQAILNKLELKRKRHSGIPDPANLICVEDIDLLLNDVARESQLLVHAHYNIVLAAESQHLQKATNFIESSLFQLGITPSKNAYNQLELFRTLLPGNGVELKPYDWFLTTCDAAICFLFKESLQKDEPSDFLVRFTDRQGTPVGIDMSDYPMRTNRIANRNRFVLGSSGVGKSFFMLALLEQYMLYNTDIVIVDTGHSYSGLCAYFEGKYITYTEEKPITMNPFAITAEECNVEKKDFLVTLVGLLWKGADGALGTVERDVIAYVISAYYSTYFLEHDDGAGPYEINELSFNSFYEYALAKIPDIKTQENIPFQLEEFRYVLKKFYRGGEYDSILNESIDDSLFTERFIVFEIDNIANNATLFPITTLIIMDVFIQKMRHRKDRRKVLLLEEAWKAIASPIMAGFLLYLNKTARKFWGEIIEVTQELADIIGNPIVKDAIIANSDTICLLDQSKLEKNFDEVAKLLSISDSERKKIFTINRLDNKAGRGRFKEVYIRRGQVGEVYGVEVSIYQYFVYTTEKPEKSALEIYTKFYGSFRGGLEFFVSDFNQSKLPVNQFVTQVNNNNRPLYNHDQIPELIN